MTITKIERQKKNNKRYSIFIDGKFKFGMSGEDVLFYRLKEDMDISEKEYDNILENVIYQEAKGRAARYLGYGPRTEKEMRNKLSTYDYPENIIDKVIELLQRYDYINDLNYARKYIS
jgi:regulatory protein